MRRYESTGKIPVILRPGYTVFGERVDGQIFLHVDVHGTYSRAMKQQMLDDIALLAAFGEPLYAVHYEAQGRKQLKFLSMLGFVPDILDRDARGTPCEIYIHGRFLRLDRD